MAKEDKPQGGVHLDMGFGIGNGAAPSLHATADLTFKLVIVGDFGVTGSGAPRDISSEDIASLLASFGAAATIEVPNHLGTTPLALAIRLPLRTMRDLDPATIAARIPEIVEAERLAAAAKNAADFEALAPTSRLDKVIAKLQRPAVQAAPVAHNGTATDEDNGSLARLLSMVDLPTEPPRPDPAKAALSAFVSSIKTSQRADVHAPSPIESLRQAQAREVVTHPTWLGIEAAWRALRLILAARASRAATRLALCGTPRDGLADLLHSEAFGAALGDTDFAAILVIGAFGRTPKELEYLDRVAEAAQKWAMPTIVSLAPDFFGVSPEAVAKMDNPASLLAAPSYAAWRGLRGRDESRLVFAAWNGVVLRLPAGAAPLLWGEPGVILAAQILRSLVRVGWPTEITGTETAIGGLDVVEIEMRGGVKAALPVRAALDSGTARDLANEGILCLVGRSDRDSAWFLRALSLHGLGKTPDADRKMIESFVSLPFQFVSRYFAELLQRNRTAFTAASSDVEAASAIKRLLDDVLLSTGPGGSAEVAPVRSDNGSHSFEVAIRLGRSVMAGFSFSFDIDL